jgi:hypothetical protein
LSNLPFKNYPFNKLNWILGAQIASTGRDECLKYFEELQELKKEQMVVGESEEETSESSISRNSW